MRSSLKVSCTTAGLPRSGVAGSAAVNSFAQVASQPPCTHLQQAKETVEDVVRRHQLAKVFEAKQVAKDGKVAAQGGGNSAGDTRASTEQCCA